MVPLIATGVRGLPLIQKTRGKSHNTTPLIANMGLLEKLTSPKGLIVISIVFILLGLAAVSSQTNNVDWYNENCTSLFGGGSAEDCEQARENADIDGYSAVFCCGGGAILLLVGIIQLNRDRKAEKVELTEKISSLQRQVDDMAQENGND